MYYYFNLLIEIANFDILPADIILKKILLFSDEEKPHIENFKIMGYETTNFILNTGSLFIYSFITFWAMIITLLSIIILG